MNSPIVAMVRIPASFGAWLLHSPALSFGTSPGWATVTGFDTQERLEEVSFVRRPVGCVLLTAGQRETRAG